MILADLIELVALACLAVAAFVIVGVPGVLIASGVALFYLSRVYSGRPVKLATLKRPTSKLPFKRGSA
jgi:hypothetical protein